MKELKKDNLQVEIYDTRSEMGQAAATDIVAAIKVVLQKKDFCNMIFAAAPSQNEVLQTLAESDVEWDRVNAFHMDEYIGLPASAPQGFANFLRRALFDKVPFASVNCLDSTGDPQQEAARYSALLQKNPTDIVVMGVGENGHIAFNDPAVAMFDDPALVKPVELDDICRQQQVNDGCFAAFDDVPKTAMTLTIPALTKAGMAFCIVPGKTKANAIDHMLNGVIEEKCPASILRRHEHAKMYLDKDSASEL